jgi:dienelactone hydrolase
VFKSRRAGPGGTEIWTVVDGGQGKFESRQEVRERTRTFTKEKLLVSIPKTFYESGDKKGQPQQWDKPEELECGVLKSKKADAGQGADDKLLRGWLDIDEYFGGGAAPADTSAGVLNRVFVGKKQAAAALAAQT